MDPLSITCSIVTLIGATRKVIDICQNYKAAVKGADWELPRIIEEVESLRGVLQGLERLAKQAENADPAAMSQLPQLSRLCDPKTGTFALCLSELQTLERKLVPPGWTGDSESKLKKSIQALGWPLKKAFVKETLGNLERFKASLNLDLVTIGVEGTVSLQNTANATQTEVLRVGQNTIDLNASFRSMRIDDHTVEVLRWLSVLDPSVKHNKTLRDRNAKTGNWLLEYEAFSEWKQTPASLLWLFGIPGCGKTVLSSTVIEHVLDRGNSDSALILAYFYIDFSEEETQIPENMIRSLLKQICCQSPSAAQRLDSLYSSCANGTKQPTLDELLLVLHGVLNNKKDGETFFVIDALDECNEREKLLRLLERIYEQKHPKLHILVTSRQELDIEESLEAMTTDEARICIQSELVQGDILTYIHDRLETDNSLKRFKRQPKIQEKIREALIEKADGMFRWVACQLDSLKNCLNPTSLEKALKSLPKTLDKTYERILCDIDEQYRDYARKILYWLTYSTRTLRLVEVAEIVAMDARTEPRFNPENRFFDSKEILVICSSLVSVFTGLVKTSEGWGDWPCVKLAHFSVKEYLASIDIQKGPAKMYAMSREIANTSIAESCLAFLLHFDKPDSLTSELEEEGAPSSRSRSSKYRARKESLYLQFEPKFPLAQYAAENWVKHASNASWDRDSIGGLVLELFIKRDSLENWIRLHDPDKPWRIEPDLSKPSIDIGPPIYYASQAGFVQLLRQLIETGADVNARGGTYGNALQVASYEGHQEIIHLLLDKGADVNASGGEYGNALQAASHKGHQEIIRLLLDKGANVHAPGGEYGNALQVASYEGHQEVIHLLLDKGADVNAPGEKYGNALQAASRGGHQEIIHLLLDKGADVNAPGGRYGNALQAASHKGHQEIIRLLLDKGADVKAPGGEFGNALQAASCYGHQQIVKMLLDAGADVNARGGLYGNALRAASYEGRQRIMKMLLDAGADVNAQGGEYGSALQIASLLEGHQKIMEILLDAGADVNAQGGAYGNALQVASSYGHQQIVKMFLDAGADVNARGGLYGNALQAASFGGHQQIVQILLDAGADVNAQGGEYGSALQAALSGGHQEIAQFLRDHGAQEDVKSLENDEDSEESDWT